MIAEKNNIMNSRLVFDRTYRDAPRQAVDELVRFRGAHPLKRAGRQGVEWEYIISGRGSEALLILPGLLGFGEMSFQHIQAFEDDYRVIAPSYPFELTTVKQLVAGIVALLDVEGVQRAYVLGGSYGGMVAQCLVRRYPQRVLSLVLSHTGGCQSAIHHAAALVAHEFAPRHAQGRHAQIAASCARTNSVLGSVFKRNDCAPDQGRSDRPLSSSDRF
jgi:pimeloyl-ACP methyl ester carboxylesterase